METIVDSVEEVWTDLSTGGENGENQLDRDDEKGI